MPDNLMDTTFTAKERDLIRREFRGVFGHPRALADGVMVRRWASGPKEGQPKFLAAVESMLDRGLMSFSDDGKRWPLVHFTDAGWRALRRLAEDTRFLPPDQYQHVHDELAASERGR